MSSLLSEDTESISTNWEKNVEVCASTIKVNMEILFKSINFVKNLQIPYFANT